MASYISNRASQTVPVHHTQLHSIIGSTSSIEKPKPKSQLNSETPHSCAIISSTGFENETEATVCQNTEEMQASKDQIDRWAPFYKVCAVVANIAHNVLKVFGSLLLIASNSTLFCTGIVYGFVKDGNKGEDGIVRNPVKDTLNKVHDLYQANSWCSLALLGAVSFISLQVTLGVTAFAVGAGIGSKLARDVQKIKEGKEPSHKPFWYLYNLV